MKKIILALSLIFIITAGSAFANEVKVPTRALESFTKEFSTAQDINWTSGNNYYMATFVLNGQNVFAYYTPDGEFISTARYLSTLQLPFNLLTNLKNEYSRYWVSDLFEVSNHEGTAYYVTLENAETKLMLKSKNSNYWDSYSKKQKV